MFNHFSRMPKQSQENDRTRLSAMAPNFHVAFKKEFATHRLPTPKHIRHIRIQGDHNNSKMERMNGEVRDREKVMRRLKIADTKILPGYQLYHNYFRPHMALDGKTPAEVCGIKIEGKNSGKRCLDSMHIWPLPILLFQALQDEKRRLFAQCSILDPISRHSCPYHEGYLIYVAV
jgi:hypothetical protein